MVKEKFSTKPHLIFLLQTTNHLKVISKTPTWKSCIHINLKMENRPTTQRNFCLIKF